MVLIRVITHMDLGVAEMRFISFGKHPLLMTRTGVSDPGLKGPLIHSSDG